MQANSNKIQSHTAEEHRKHKTSKMAQLQKASKQSRQKLAKSSEGKIQGCQTPAHTQEKNEPHTAITVKSDQKTK